MQFWKQRVRSWGVVSTLTTAQRPSQVRKPSVWVPPVSISMVTIGQALFYCHLQLFYVFIREAHGADEAFPLTAGAVAVRSAQNQKSVFLGQLAVVLNRLGKMLAVVNLDTHQSPGNQAGDQFIAVRNSRMGQNRNPAGAPDHLDS